MRLSVVWILIGLFGGATVAEAGATDIADLPTRNNRQVFSGVLADFVPAIPLFSCSASLDSIIVTASLPTMSPVEQGPLADARIGIENISTMPSLGSAVSTPLSGPRAGAARSATSGGAFSVTVIPEPAALALLAAVLVGVAATRRRRPACPLAGPSRQAADQRRGRPDASWR